MTKFTKEWDSYFMGHVEFDWFSEKIDSDMLQRALDSSIYINKGIRAKETDKEGIVYLKNLKVSGSTKEDV